jgi:acylaminoacyl-peptidase
MARPLIPRRALFDNPTFMDAKLSPHGTWLSWIAPVDGVLNVWVAPRGDLKAAAPLTRMTGRPIPWHNWLHDDRTVLFAKDETGDENVHLYAADAVTRDLRDLTPIVGIAAQWIIGSPDLPGEVIVGLNDRDARWHDRYKVDVATGTRTLVWENTQDLAWIGFDWSHTPRWARSSLPGGGAKLWRIEGSTLTPWREVSYEDALGTSPMMFNRTNTHLHMRSTIGRDTAAFTRVDWTTGAETVVAAHDRADVASVLFDMATFDIAAASANTTRETWFYRTPAVAADFARLAEHLPDFEIGVTDQPHDDRHWIVMAHKPEQAATYFHYSRDAGTLVEVGRARPALATARLAPMRAIEAKARDGLDLVSYLTLPADVAGEIPPAPLPMVLIVHGGPWARDTYSYRADHQWLADRGYAVLSVNYRGSTGFGKAFVEASVGEHAKKMHDDLIDMVQWAIREGIADPKKVAIYGGSYGGYASFVGATFTPDVFCAAVPVVGITNLQTLLESIPPYWAGFAEVMYRSYGDPRTEEGRARLAAGSPIHKVDAIRCPMLILHGANDVRCKIAESDTIVAAMQARGIPVSYVVYPDEGHGFAKPANRLAAIALIEGFLARVMGGALEPLGDDVAGSSHEIRAGADLVSMPS